jgi:hypothetical protein
MDNRWYKTAVIYELCIKDFQDSSRDDATDEDIFRRIHYQDRRRANGRRMQS